MKMKIFGGAREALNNDSIHIDAPISTIADVRVFLKEKYGQDHNFHQYMIAKNLTYASDDEIIKPDDELALIPPVSGG